MKIKHYINHTPISYNNFNYKKANAWKKALVVLEKEAIANGIFVWKTIEYQGKKFRCRMGICMDCGKYRNLTPDHLIKRSQGGLHDKQNIDWICKKCHDLRDNKGDPMNKKPVSNKKVNWMKPHKCIHCHRELSGLLCTCGQLSV